MTAVNEKKTLPELEIQKKFKGIDDSILQNIMVFNGNFHGKVRSLLLPNDKVYNIISKYIRGDNWEMTKDNRSHYKFDSDGMLDEVVNEARYYIEIPIAKWMLDDIIKDKIQVVFFSQNMKKDARRCIEKRLHDDVIEIGGERIEMTEFEELKIKEKYNWKFCH